VLHEVVKDGLSDLLLVDFEQRLRRVKLEMPRVCLSQKPREVFV
jgi:hypothetical protein